MIGRLVLIAAALASAYVVSRGDVVASLEQGGRRLRDLAEQAAGGLRGTVTAWVDTDGDGEVDPGESSGSSSWNDEAGGDEAPNPAKRAGCACGGAS